MYPLSPLELYKENTPFLINIALCADLDSYLDMVITGVDRAGLRQVDGARLLDRSGSEAAIKLPSSSPRRNTYLSLPTRDLPQERFNVALVGKDSSGKSCRGIDFFASSQNGHIYIISMSSNERENKKR